jgi:hypothetical protein
MFKRKERSQKAQKRKQEDSDDDDEKEESNLYDQLQTTKKRRALIHQLQFKRGVDANKLLAPQPNTKTTNAPFVARKSKDSTSAASSTLDGKNDDANQSIWEKKHTDAMKDFVETQLAQSQQSAENNTGNKSLAEDVTNNTSAESAATGTRVQNLTKAQIYRALAAETALLGSSPTTSTAAASSSSSSALKEASNSKDVLTAGAATALAEVILPVADRLHVVAETARATTTANTNTTNDRAVHSLTALTRPAKNSAIPNRFRSHHNHHHPNTGSFLDHAKTTNADTTISSSNATSTDAMVDADRVGFAAARQQQFSSRQASAVRGGGGSGGASGHSAIKNRSSDDRVYQQFVKRQREQQHGR